MNMSLSRAHWRQWLCIRDLVLFASIAFSMAVDLPADAALDHFYWSAPPSTVQVGGPFFVTLRARSLGNSSDTNFNGVVQVTELIPSQPSGVLITEVQTINTNRVELSNLSATPVDVSGWQVVFYDSASWPAPKVAFTIPTGTVCPGYGVFEVRGSNFFPGTYPVFNAGVTLAWSTNPINNPIAVLLLDAQGNTVDFFCAGSAYPPYIAVPSSIPEAIWSGPPVVVPPGWSNKALDYQRQGNSDQNNAADWVIATNSFGVLNPQLQFPFIGLASQFAVVPASVTLTNGKWNGLLAVSAPGTNAFLRADDGDGLPGDSTPFTVLSLPALKVQVPPAAFKATSGLVGQGEVFIPQPLSSNLAVALSSSLTNEIVVPLSVTIAAGATNAVFTVSNVDDGLLEGPQTAAVLVVASGFAAGTDWITNYDRPTASVSVSAPSGLLETAGWVTTGQVHSGSPVAANVAVQLTSSNPNKLMVPDSVIILAGQSTARFGLAVIQNPFIDGNQRVTITASVPGWMAGQAQVLVVDNKTTNLSLSLPRQLNAGAGVITNGGTILISGLLSTDLVVTLNNSLPAKIQVPASVVIPSGHTSAAFDLAVPSDSLLDGNQAVVVTARANGFGAASSTVTIIDNEVFSFSFASLPAVQVAGQPFPVTIYALNPSGAVVPGYSITVNLRATGVGGSMSIMPTSVGPFTNGVWSGLVTIPTESRTTILSAYDGSGHSGSSAPFDVVAGVVWNLAVSDFAYDPLRQKIQVALLSTATTNPQCTVALDPVSGAMGSPIALGANPGKVALSGDDQFLYVGIAGTGGVARVDLEPGTVGLRFTTGQSQGIPYEMAVPPGDPHALVAWISGGQGLALFRDGAQSPDVVGPDVYNTDPYDLIFYDSSTNFYSASGVGYGVSCLNIAANGVHLVQGVTGYDEGYLYEGGLLFGTSGDVYDPVNFRHLGAYPTNGLVAANANVGQVYFLSGSTILVFDMTTFAPIGNINLPIAAGTATKLVSCGTNGLAVATANQLMVVRSDLVPSPAQADLLVTQTTELNTGVVGSNFTYSVTVSNAGPARAPDAILADVLPADAVFVSATNSQSPCTLTNGILRCDLGPLAPGASLTTTLVIQPATPGNMVNLAWIIGDGINLTNGTSRMSNTVVFGSTLPAVTRLWLSANSMAYDSLRNALWFSTEELGGASDNCLLSINLSNGLPGDVVPLNYPSSKIAISANAQYLYASYYTRTDISYSSETYGFYISRANLLTDVVDLSFSAVDVVGQQDDVLDMIGISAYPNDVLVAEGGVNADIALYENGAGIRRAPYYEPPGKLEVNPTIPTRFYRLSGSLDKLDIGSATINVLGSMDFSGLDLRYGEGLLFSDSGFVVDPEAMTNVAQLPIAGLIQTDPASGHVFYLVQNGSQVALTAFDITTFSQIGSFVVPGVIGTAANLTRCAPGILAFSTDDDQLFILNTSQMPYALESDLTVSETASVNSSTTNIPVTFTTLISNAGPSSATGVILTNELPSDAVVLGITASQGTVTNLGNTIICDVGNLELGATAWLQVVTTFTHAGQLTDMANVSQNTPDPITTNNFASATVRFSTIPISDLSVSQVELLAPVLPGSNFVCRLSISNSGPDTATGVQFSDTLVSGAVMVSATASQGSVSQSTGSANINLGVISNGLAATVDFVLSPSGGGLFMNVADVSGDNFDPDTANNQSFSVISLLNTNGQNFADEIPIFASDIACDASNHQIVASTTQSSTPNNNSVVGVSTTNEALIFQVPLGNQLGRLALSDDSRFAYVGIADTGGVCRVDIPSRAEDLRFGLNPPDPTWGAFIVDDLTVMPGHPDTLAAASALSVGFGGTVALYDSGVERPDTITSLPVQIRVGFANDTNLYITTPSDFQATIVTPTGLTNQGSVFSEYSGDFALDGGYVFLANGSVFDPNTGDLVVSFPTAGFVVPDLANGRVYFLTSVTGGNYYFHSITVRAFDWQTQSELWSVDFNAFIGYETRFIKLGTEGLAFLTDSGRLFLLRTPQLTQPISDISISQAVTAGSITVGGSVAYTLTVQNFGPWSASGVVVSNPVPSGTSFVSASATQGNCVVTNGSVLCELGSMTNGATATVTINLMAAAVGTVTNVALVTQNEDDPNPNNNTTTVSTTVNPQPPQPSVTIGDAIVSQGIGQSTISFLLTLSSPTISTVSVGYHTADGTALAGQGYSTASGMVVISPGSTSFQLNLPIIRSNISTNASSFFFLNLTSVTNAVLARTQAVGTIVQERFYDVSVKSVVVETKWGATNATFQVALFPPSAVPVRVLYRTVDRSAVAGADYAPRAGTLTIDPGVTNLAINVPVFAVPSSGTTKVFSLLLSQPQNAILTVNEAQAMIIEDELVGPLTIGGVQVQGTNIWIQFGTISGRYYRLERSDDLGFGSWTTVTDQIPGTGNDLMLTDPAAPSASARFYRLVLLP
jgi:uncharacterized repeat protein (TIGR01451 family)